MATKISETRIWACFTKVASHTVLFTYAGMNYPMISWGNTKTVALCVLHMCRIIYCRLFFLTGEMAFLRMISEAFGGADPTKQVSDTV